jgi:hypothetical protein
MHYEWKNNGRILSFDVPSVTSPASFINMCLLDVLRFIHDLRTVAKEQSVRPAVIDALKAMIVAAKRAGIVFNE